ncbi:MAG: nucleoside hydrolase [Firmicutes bacterium HGW-Firmicutes-20]|jgi:purine nucleosidase|nr:MAG: nucleoside hydrolase [Firmicutes bacterium HGW-Firmicutes-20]
MDKIKLIMDVDPGIDDSLALLLAGLSPEIELLAITVVSGNIEVDQAARNAKFSMRMIGRDDVMIAKGCARPIHRNYVDATDTHGIDGIGEMYFPKEEPEDHGSAIEVITRLLRLYPHQITIAALGPLSNLATILKQDPEVLSLAKEIIIMGGSVNVCGNCSPVAEYNFWCDPHAAKIFFDANVHNVTLVPLDVTYKILLTPNMREMIRQFKTPLSEYVTNITGFYVDFHWAQERTLGCVINDPLVIAYILDRSILNCKFGQVQVETEGIAMGESVVDFRQSDVRLTSAIAQSVDAKRFFKLFLTRLFSEHKSDIDLMIEKRMII